MEEEQEQIQSIITIQLLDQAVMGEFNPFEKLKTALGNAYTFYELDNFSDELSFTYALQLVEKAQKIILWVDTSEYQEAGKCMSFVNQLLKSKSKTECLLIGEHALFAKVLKKTGQLGYQQFLNHEMAVQWLISTYAS